MTDRKWPNRLISLVSMTPVWRLVRLLRRDRLLEDEWEAVSGSDVKWWWECLRESEDYAAALRGERGEPFKSMADDFGELEESFPVWWLRRGRLLFAEQVLHAKAAELPELLTAKDGVWFVTTRDKARPSLYLRVPLLSDRREIMRQVGELVDHALQKRQDEIAAALRPKRTLRTSQRLRRDTLQTLLAVWRARKSTDEPWWLTGERLGYWPQFKCLPSDDEDAIKQKRRIMSLTVQRHHRMATKLIEFAARGDFPRLK